MKKIIGIIGTVAIAIAMFFSANTINSSNGNLDLASLLEVNTANAECDWSTCDNYCYSGNQCFLWCNGWYIPCFGYSNTQ
ncbi:hypothetical protein [Flavivirga algicola]|uniref:Uncharacterized protein n=1 Tax=Flavivirga algicola TaxID=2729136 RepID=A0ABX1S456_9FLAO|nr:hypothetical protein [Flavivirga algicola]NMH89990.1 hypothetical protein [Flavivirga algicola]